jgi:hypothetical protein
MYLFSATKTFSVVFDEGTEGEKRREYETGSFQGFARNIGGCIFGQGVIL